MFKKFLQSIIILLPILLLMTLAAYFTYINWGKYQKNTLLKTQLNNTKQLQLLEHSVLNEIVCIATMEKHKNLMQKVCNPTKKTTDTVMRQILSQSNDKSLYGLEKTILDIRKSIENSGTVAVEKLVNGNLDKEMNGFIQRYTDKLTNDSQDMNKKEYLRLYADITNIAYATESEKALVSYYLSLKKPIPANTLIYWDKVINQSQIHESEQNKISVLHEDIESLFNQKSFQENLRKIEDIRLDIMSNSYTGRYKSGIETWVGTINKKQKVLHNVESMLLDTIYNDVSKELKSSTMILYLSLFALLSSILALLFLLAYWRKNARKRKLLDELVTKISEVSSNKKLDVTESIDSHKVAYNYIASQYEYLNEKESKLSNENKTNKVFFNNLAYEIKTPLYGISGYTKLLKETPLTIEQNDFLNVIENSFENLDAILSKASNDYIRPNQKLEIENITFDLLKVIEASVETFSVKADQKDIVLGLFIDPNLVHNVKGDSTKLSHILTNLVDNALESSSAYHAIDITISIVDIGDEKISVKFEVKDESIGYDDSELNKIRHALVNIEATGNIPNLDMKNLTISNKIIKRMGGDLELVSKKGEGSTFFFTLTFERDNVLEDRESYPLFRGMRVGLALPSKEIKRQIDDNLERYVKHLEGKFEIYDYDTLLNEDGPIPDLLFVYHNYARLEGELEAFRKLPTKIALITSGTLRPRINMEGHTFSSITYAPLTMRKVLKILLESKIEKLNLLEKNTDETEKIVTFDEVKTYDNLSALVVEDNEISQKIMSNILKKLNIDVTIASDGKEAFDLRREKDFNIIFMDLDMPIMDGTESTSKMMYYERVNQVSHVPIIAMISDISSEDRVKCLDAGMDDCIAKPIDEENLYEFVEKYCIEMPKKLAETEEDDFIAKVLSGDFLKEDT